jgi:DNA polymerase I-like protein with 3'-5' exonuclease and polymerase domains
VDPFTREPLVIEEDLDEIQEYIDSADVLVLQNANFDEGALAELFKKFDRKLRWAWSKVKDTLLAGHLLASNRPHNLTAMSLQYLGINIEPLELALAEGVKKARQLVRTKDFIAKHGRWAWAEKGLASMPSAKEVVWRFDYWLPAAVAIAEGYAEDHPWRTLLPEYGNGDSSVTLPLLKAQLRELERRKLTRIYEERLKILPIVSKMEERGISVSRENLDRLHERFTIDSEALGRKCVNIAASLDYDLSLPKNGMNKSLASFAFGALGLPVIKKSDKTGEPSLDKFCLEQYQATLPERSKQLSFVNALQSKRKCDTANTYGEGYRRYWIPLGVFNDKGEQLWYRLHPSLNPTGTDTLRWSSSNPSEQNISKQEGFNLREAFAPLPGRAWYSKDAKNIELRIPAYASGERLLIDLFERPDEPPYYGSTHLLNFHTVYDDIWDKELRSGVPLEKVGPHCKKKYASTWYQWVKNGGFAVQYGAVEKEEGTADKAFHRPGSHAKLKARFSKLDILNTRQIKFAERFGYVETIPDKTVDPERGYPLLCTRTEWGNILPTVPLNYYVQGTAMWWMMKAMIRVQAFLDRLNRADSTLPGSIYRLAYKYRGEGFYLIMQVHDELVFDFPAGTGEEPYNEFLPILRELKRLMEQGGDDIGIPTPVSCEYHPNNWAEGLTIAI